MASQFVAILPKKTLLANSFMKDDDIVDLGAYRVLVCDCWVSKPGTGTAQGKVVLQTSAIKNNEDEWRDIASWIIDSTGTGGMVEVATFLRFVRWRTDNNVAGSPVAGISLIAKE